MKLLLSIITLFISYIYSSDAQEVVGSSSPVAFTPNTTIFAFPEDERSPGFVYFTSNVNINPVFTTNGNYSISSDGEVILIELLDYELTFDRIQFSDVQEDTYNISADLIFCVLDVNDNAPTSPVPTALMINTPESSIGVSEFTMRFYSNDVDSNLNGTVTFMLVDNGTLNNNRLFTISSDGILQNNVPLSQNDFTIIVQATDGGSPAFSSQTSFTLTITTNIGAYLDRYTSFVPEDTPIGAVIDTLPFTGPFHINITYGNYLKYNQTTGDLVVVTNFDFEYDSEVHLDLLNSTAFVTELVIYVTNVVESAPEFLTTFPEELSVLSIAGSIAYCPDVYIREVNALLTFELVNASSIFSIDSNDGIISLAHSIVYDTPRVYNITLRVSDRGVSSDADISLIPAFSDIPIPSRPQSLTVTPLTDALFSISWQEPIGVFPSHIFTRGYLYRFAYFSLSNISNILTQYTSSNSLNITLFAGPVHLFLVQSSLLNEQYGDNVITSYGDAFITATTINSSVIQISFYQLDFCGNDTLYIQYEIEYFGMFNDPTSSFLYVNVTQQTNNVTNITSCFTDPVYLTSLTSATNYVIHLYVTIPELDVYSVLIARNVSNFTDPIDEIFKYPEYPLCIGEDINIDCEFDYNRISYISNGTVYFSFNGSTPLSYQINSENQTDNGIDLMNYNYTEDSSMLYAIIYTLDGLTEQDFSITFSCHLLTSNTTFSEDVLSTRIERVVPPSSPSCNATSVSFNKYTCQLNITLYWPYVLSERNDTNYTVWEDGMVIHSTLSNSFNHSTILRAPTTEYNLTLSAENCAGNSTQDVCYIRPVPDILSKPNCRVTFTSFNGYMCSLFIVLSWSYVPSDRNATIYNIKQNGFVSETSRNIGSHSYNFSSISPEFGYTLSLSAEDCAGESEDDTCYIIPGYSVKNQSLDLDFDNSTGNLTLIWILDQLPVFPTEDHIIIQYSIVLEVYFVGCQPPFGSNFSVENIIFSQLSNLSNYTLNIYTPRVSELSINVTLELVQLCDQNVTETLPQRQSYGFLFLPEVPPPNCTLDTFSINPYTCQATHSFQTDSSLTTTLYYTTNDTRTIIGDNSLIDSRIITPNTPYSYSMTAEDCNVDSEPVICYESTIPSYSVKNQSLDLDFDNSTGNLTLIWILDQLPVFPTEDHIIIQYSIVLEVYFVGCQPPFGLNFSVENIIFSQLSNLSNYTLNVYTPRVSELSINVTLELVQLCDQNVTETLPQRQSYGFLLPEVTPPNCTLDTFSINPYTCQATHSFQTDSSLTTTLYYTTNDTRTIIGDNSLIDSRIITPNTPYSYSMTAEDCNVDSEPVICYESTIPSYSVKNQSLDLDFDNSTGNLTLIWILDQLPVFPTEDHIIIQYSIVLEVYFVGCQPPFGLNFSVENIIFSQLSNLSNYTLNVYTPRVSELSINVTLELVQLCDQNVTETLPQRQSYGFLLPEVTPPNCTLDTFSINPYTCQATHSFQTDSSLTTTLYYTTNDTRTIIGDNSLIDSRIITPNTPYSYSMTAEDCNVDSEPVICYESTIPSYQFDLNSLSIDYIPQIDRITFLWIFNRYPSSAPAHTIVLTIGYSITLNYTISGSQDTSVLYCKVENQLPILSNETVYEDSGCIDKTDDVVVESLIISISIWIVAQCNHTIDNTPVTATYNYTIAPCQETNTCFKDADDDGYPDTLMFCNFLDMLCVDNCPQTSNPHQSDCNANGVGDACDRTCLPERDTAFGYNWTCTEGGQTVSQTCIQGAGNATRVCGQYGDWSTLVNTSLCFSAAFNEIKQNISIDSLIVIVDIFKNNTAPATSGDIGVIVAVLDTTIEATTNVTREEVEVILTNTLIVVDVLADDSSQTLLTQSQEDTQVAQKVLNVLETQASNLALISQENVKLDTSKNVFIETRTVVASQSEVIVINANNIKEETEDTPTVSIPIPEGLNSSLRLSVSVVVMRNIGKLISSFSDDITVGVEGLKLNNFAEFEIVSPMISIQLFSGNELLTTDGSDTLAELSIPLSLSQIDLTERYIKLTCIFLGNASSSNPNWEDSGIQNVSADDITNGVLTCLPGHNTAFVVLVGVGSLESQTVVLNILSYIGCSLSVICLLISMVIYLIFGRNLLRKIYHFVHFKLALSLCLLYLAFLFGVEPAYANVWLYIPCKIVTVVVEYFLLVTFLWMLMEGIVVFIMIMWPFHQFNWKHFVIFACISWGLPLIYVIPFIPFFHEYYISPPNHLNSSVLTSSAKYCFIHNDENTNLIYSITAPLAVVIIMNFMVLSIVIIRCVLLIVRQKSLSKLQRTQKTALRLLRLLLVMFPVLGFGWSFGLLAIYFNTTVFAWMFTIFSAFQGILFLFLVLLLRRDIQRYIVNLLNFKSKYLTLHSRISSYYSKPVSTRVTSVVTKQTLIFDQPQMTHDLQFPPSVVNDLEFQAGLTTASRIFAADKLGMLPPTVELEEILMFYEEKKYSRIESITKPEVDKENIDIFEKLARDLDELAKQITEVDND